MKNNIIKSCSKFISMSILAVFVMMSCEKDDVFTGSPQGTDVNFITLRGSITSPDTDVVSSQTFPVTISLGDNLETPEADLLTFPVDVTVEATSFLPNLNKRARKTFVIPAGQNSLVSTMIAPSGDATTDLPFELEMILYLSAITTSPNEDNTRGFEGKQYSIVSDTLSFGYGDTAFGAINAKRLAIRFDFLGPYSGTTANNLNIVLKKNGSVMQSQSSIQGVSPNSSTKRPLYGTLSNTTRYESLNFLDIEQELKLSNITSSDSINGVYTVKAPSSNQGSNDKPHGFKVGDEVSIENIDGINSVPLVVLVASVSDPYTFTFNYSGPHLFSGKGVSFYQPIIVPRLNYLPQTWVASTGYSINTPVIYNGVTYFALVDIAANSSQSNQLPSVLNSLLWTTQPNGTWSPFLAYSANESVIIDSVTYYAIRNIAVNPMGSLVPSIDIANWTTVKPKINWSTAFLNPPTWVAGSSTVPQIYLANDIYKFNNVVYVCTKQHTITSGTPNPAADTARWTTAVVEYTADVLNYTSTDTYSMEVYALRLGGSTTTTTPVNMPYKISLRFPDEVTKVYSSEFNNMTIGTPSTAIPKLQIVKTTVQGVSTYVVTHL
jgi:hypothetical protein